MKKGKYSNGRARKPVALLLALVLVLGIAIGGTIAWLTDTTGEVKNTFTTSDVDIDLKETKTDFQMVPGHTIEKDPIVTVLKESEDCWLFVEITESATLDTYINYAIAAGWTEIEDGDGNANTTVIARKVFAADEDQDFEIIGYTNDEDEFIVNKVLVNGNVTKDKMDDLGEADAVQPTLTFQAYATQLWKSNKPADGATEEAIAAAQFTAAEAWALAKPTP